MKAIHSLDKLSVKLTERWFEQLPLSSPIKSLQPEDTVMALSAEANNILDSETRLYNQIKEGKKDKDYLWVKRILHSGTLSDKISAYTLLIQEAPVYNLSHIETLIAMVNTKGKRECIMAMDSLKELFLNVVLIEDRKLKQFKEQPLCELDSFSKTSPILKKRYLLLWLFEDKLKSLYKVFLNNVNAVSHDTIEKTKLKAVNVIFNLLKENPEQEQFLLEHLVNKVGDPVPKVGSHVCHLLGQLIVQHPDMKAIVSQEVERLLFRPNLPDRAKYYALCFLNQIILSHEEFQLANNLIMIYFGQFKLFVKKGEVNTKMMSALLTGVARAYPFAKLKENVIMEQLDAMYRLVHVVSFNISIQALMLIFQVLDSKDSLSDRFYCALYRKLFDPALSGSSRQASLLNLVYRALKKDVAAVRVKAFVKRLLQISLYQSQNLQCGILVMLSEVQKIHPGILDIKQSFDYDSDSEEHYEDVLDENTESKESLEKGQGGSKVKTQSSWVHRQKSQKTQKTSYDFHSRNPLHAGAEFSNVWELLFLKQSFHPSVSLFAHQLLSSKEIKYSGDPLLDFTTSRFLDRFVYRNPKKQSEHFEQDVYARVFGPRKLKACLSKLLPVNTAEYMQQNVLSVPVEEQFIYKYLQQRTVSHKKDKDDSDVESVCSEDFQELLDDIHPEDEGKDFLNFAKELGMKKDKKRKAVTESDAENSEGDSLGDESEEVDFDDEEFAMEFGDLDKELNDVDMENNLCEEDFIGLDEIGGKPSHKKRKADSLTDPSLLASAEEFSTLLEDNAGGKTDTVTAGAFINKDKSGAKQIAWEMERDRFVKGRKWQDKKKKHKFVKRKK